MQLYEDTRQKIGKHENIEKQCLQLGIIKERKPLKVGDYMIDCCDHITIDTKANLLELAKDFSKTDKSRFYRNFKNSIKYKIKLIILIEQGGQIKSIKDVVNWHNPLKGKIKYAISGRQLMEKIYQAHISFGIEFLFCDKRKTVATMLKLFGVTND